MCIFSVSLFFFFKQKTAYEMRISDWSSDVCSSDLLVVVEGFIERVDTDRVPPLVRKRVAALLAPLVGRDDVTLPMIERRLLLAADTPGATLHSALAAGDRRSEEHTSELQSLMRISYAVFCLKKTKITIK